MKRNNNPQFELGEVVFYGATWLVTGMNLIQLSIEGFKGNYVELTLYNMFYLLPLLCVHITAFGALIAGVQSLFERR